MIIMFVRHGDAIDDNLTDLGRKRCELMCQGEETYNFAKVYCSTVNRCKQTAEYFKNIYSLEVEYLEDLKDREVLLDTPANNIEWLWYNNYLNKNFSHDKPEGCKEFLQRNFKAFQKIIERHKIKNENVILVAHSCTFYALQEYLQNSKSDEIKYYRLSNCAKVYFEV